MPLNPHHLRSSTRACWTQPCCSTMPCAPRSSASRTRMTRCGCGRRRTRPGRWFRKWAHGCPAWLAALRLRPLCGPPQLSPPARAAEPAASRDQGVEAARTTRGGSPLAKQVKQWLMELQRVKRNATTDARLLRRPKLLHVRLLSGRARWHAVRNGFPWRHEARV